MCFFCHIQGSASQYFIGLKDFDGTLRWPDGTSTGDRGFSATASAFSNAGQCFSMDRDSSVSSSWVRTDCGESLGYICLVWTGEQQWFLLLIPCQ